MSYTAQELNTKIGLERFESYRDSDGILHEEWVTYGEAFAKVEPLVGREYLAAAQVQAEGLVKVTIRYRDDKAAGKNPPLDVKLEVVESSWANAILDVQSGKVDLAFAVTATPARWSR